MEEQGDINISILGRQEEAGHFVKLLQTTRDMVSKEIYFTLGRQEEAGDSVNLLQTTRDMEEQGDIYIYLY